MNQVGEKINVEEFKKGRDLDCLEMKKFLYAHGMKFFSWGAHAWTNVFGFALRFMVSGMKHKGHVYITCTAMDNITAYLTTSQGKIVDIIEEIGIENLFEALDNRIEKTENHKW